MSAPDLAAVRDEFLRVREAGPAEDARYRELLGILDDVYWKSVEKTVEAALEKGGDHLELEPEESLLLDAGLLDERLVARPGEDLAGRLSAELAAPGDATVLHLSQWASERLRSFLATRTLPGENVGQSLLLKAVNEQDAELARSRHQRNELYQRVAPLFEDLPGAGPELSTAIVRGTVDDRIEELLLAGAIGSPAAPEPADNEATRQARRYDRVVQRALQLVGERAQSDEELLYVETLTKLRSAIFRKSLIHARRSSDSAGEVPAGSGAAPEATRAEVRRFMRRELRLVRSLLRIGSQEGRGGMPCSVLLHDAPRTTRPLAGDTLRLVRELDPRLGLSHCLLIAPFTGGGFFEWDRDTLVAAISPARSAEESVVNAVANLRLLADARRGGGCIARTYRDQYGPKFRDHFLGDYRAWVLKIGRGRREAMNDRSFQFFAEHIGPPPGGPIIPAELARLSLKEREDRTARLEAVVRSGRADAQELHHLAVLHWQAERIDAAIKAMESAAAAAPGDGRVLYSLGLLCRRRRLVGEARRAFRDCTQVALRSLWGIYANEALRRLA